MGIFLLSPEAEAEARRVREFAERRENWYVPGVSAVPGDDPRYVFHSGTYRAVFSWTYSRERGRPYRHLSVSCERPGMAPHPLVVFNLADMLGFTGAVKQDGVVVSFGDTWQLGQDVEGNAAVVAEAVLSS